jgi:sterol desaturase/sphingolipid hydroxylase (fatty acid hydroxylase superfamily)
VGEDESRDISISSSQSGNRHMDTGSQRGVQALFSPDANGSTRGHSMSRNTWVSRRSLVGIVEWSLGIILYAGLVQQYNSNVYMRLWVHESFPFAELLLNYYGLVAVTVLGIILVFSSLLQEWHRRGIHAPE